MEITKIDPTKPYTKPRIPAETLADAEFISEGNRKAVKVYGRWTCSIGDSQEGTLSDAEIIEWVTRK
jgi:hypothetical protein